MSDTGFSLVDGMDLAGLDYPALWFRYLALGGNGTAAALREHVLSDDCPSAAEHNLIAQAINEVFLERGENHPVAYQHLYQLPDG